MSSSDAHPAGNFGDDLVPGELTEDAVAHRFSDAFKDQLRYVAKKGKWLRYDGCVWREDETLAVYDLIRQHCRRERVARNCDENVKDFGKASAVASVERLARADRRHAATVDQWDADLFLLNTPAGVIDLRSGQLCKHRLEDYMTKMTAVAAGGDCPKWRQFLSRVTDNDVELTAYLQRVAGYALTGDTSEHALFFFYGTGGNGKGVFLNTISAILGTYAAVATMETFTDSKNERHTTDLAMLQGARLVTAQETEEGRRWAESRIKSMTGGDRITARFMRQDNFTYPPQFKLMIAGNHKPGLRNVDAAMRRRVNLIPFGIKIPKEEQVTTLTEDLKSEWPGILQWMIEGCRSYLEFGLAPPPVVVNSTDEYFCEQDSVANWISECCKTGSNDYSLSESIFESWERYCNRTGEYLHTMKWLTQSLKEKGFVCRRQGGTGKAGFNGIAVLE